MKKLNIFIIFILGLFFVGCTSYMAVATAPQKAVKIKDDQARQNAINLFYKTFHLGDYSKISETLVPLKAQYLKNPNDPKLALYIAHLHFWRVAERFRMGDKSTPSITDDLTIAIKYFKEAKKLDPNDARIDGWLSGALMSEASIHMDEKDKRAAYYDGLDSIKAYPEFNYFSIGYIFSNHNPNSDTFKDAIKWYYKSMDIAYHTKVNRDNPKVDKYISLEKQETNDRLKRAVWNSKIAPHNVEGFYLNFGDFLVKSGEIEKARIIYNNAKKLPSYDKWPYAYVLEERLNNIEENVKNFRKKRDLRNSDFDEIVHERMIFNSYNCMVCHQANK